MHSIISLSRVKGDLLFKFSLIFLVLQSTNLRAQVPPFNLEEVFISYPQSIVEHELYLGTAEIPIASTTNIELVYKYSGYTILNPSNINLEAGEWFTNDGFWEGSISVDETKREITLQLDRTNGESVSGYGLSVKVKSIIIEIDDIHRSASNEYSLISLKTNNIEPINIYPNPTKNDIRLKHNLIDVQIYKLYNVWGKFVKEYHANSTKLSMRDLNPGIYYLQITHSAGTEIRKIIRN